MGTTAKGFRYPDGTDPALIPADIGELAQDVDDVLDGLTYAEINALTGAAVWAGRTVYQTNTGTNRPREGLYQHNGVEWRKPWNMPWGVMPSGVASITANQDGNGAEADITGLTLTNTYVANRWVRATLTGRYSQNSSGTPHWYVNDGVSHDVFSITNGAGETGTFYGVYLLSPAAGSLVVKARVASAAGTVDTIASSTTPARLVLEDIGPAGAAS